jgi:hypothetical protein
MTAHMTEKLPQRFRDLENWLDWSLATEGERYAKRAGSSLDDLRAYSGALTPHMHEIIGHLSNIPWGTPLGEADENLYRLGLSYMEVAVPLDLGWKSSTAVDSFPVDRLNLPDRL